MAYLSYKGYRLMKGRRGKGMVLIIAAVLIVFIYAAVIISFTISDYNNLKVHTENAFQLFSGELRRPFGPADNNTGDLWTEIGLGWFFAAAGSALFLTKIFKPGANKGITIKRLEPDGNIEGSDAPKE